jgi:excisionase family DNA binding protein
MGQSRMDDLITSAEAAKLAGVGPTAIKRWADTGTLKCIKTAGGHRRFHRADVLRLVRVEASADDEFDDWIELLVGDHDSRLVTGRLLELRARVGAWHLAADWLGGLLREIGRRWETGQVSVIQEHLASAALQRALAAVCETIPVAPAAPRCLLATADGDDHTLGLSLVELCLAEAGWRAEWAGNRTRPEDLADRVASGGLGMIALSASRASTEARGLARQAHAAGEACRAAGIALVLGGEGAWPDAPAHGTRFSSLPPFFEFARERAGGVDK